MVKRIACPSCGASLKIEEGKSGANCCYCGSQIVYSQAKEVVSSGATQDELTAVSFMNSLIIEVKGQRASIADLWDSIMNNKNYGEVELFKFYKNYSKRILFCLNIYKKLSPEVKYEVGDFICAQMNSIINFRVKHALFYSEELDELKVYREKLKYEYGSIGFFDFKKKLLHKKKLDRVAARESIIIYHDAMYALSKIVKDFDNRKVVLQEEYDATPKTAFARRKALKDKINGLEKAKKYEMDRLCIAGKTKEYNKYVKKYNINPVDMLKEEAGIIDEPIQTTSTQKAVTKAAKKVESQPVVEKINYNELSLNDLLTKLEGSLNILAKGAVQSEINNCKEIGNALAQQGGLDNTARVYLSAITMSINMMFQNSNPTIMKAMITNTTPNIKMQINNLRGCLK
ncbi:MAG: hypothetical protein IJY57_01705 [Clostridia bacterium]|nr:hypothetical protein [Clostridia bacterium]